MIAHLVSDECRFLRVSVYIRAFVSTSLFSRESESTLSSRGRKEGGCATRLIDQITSLSLSSLNSVERSKVERCVVSLETFTAILFLRSDRFVFGFIV